MRLCEGHACEFDLSVGRDAFEIGGATRPSDLDVELQLIAAYLSDPGFRPALDARIPTAVRTLYKITRSEPGFAAALARDNALPPPRVPLLPDEHDLDGVKSADFARILGPILKHDALEVTIVGDISESAATDAVAKDAGGAAAAALARHPPRRRADGALSAHRDGRGAHHPRRLAGEGDRAGRPGRCSSGTRARCASSARSTCWPTSSRAKRSTTSASASARPIRRR
ncbi:MAG: hypothetical protein WDM85_15840 [Caulobacteraceae bacterium]